jgi:hypothetical protein
MKQPLSLLIVLLIFAGPAKAQKDTTTYVNPSKISAIGQLIVFPGKSFQSFGLQIEASVGRHLYLNYHFGMGTSSGGGLYVHAPLGAAGGASLFVASLGGEKGLGWLGFLLCLVPEGVGYRIPIGKKIEFVPYIDPLQCDYRIHESTFGEEFNFSGDAGARLVFKFPKKFFFQGHFGSKLLYNNGEWGVEGGASIGKYF